jgi:hypothetical protein
MLGATGLLGKRITFLNSTSNAAQSGIVESLKITDGAVQVGVNGGTVGLSDILNVGQ